jgi:hypothetical protein
MKLYIKLENGQPIDHPMLKENVIQAFPDIDINNLPETFIEFVRVAHPSNLSTYEIYDGVHYEIIDGVCTDVHSVRTLTAEEKQEKQDQVKSDWAEHGYPSWIFDEATCSFDSPIGSPPPDGKAHVWNEATISWIEVDE